MNKIVDKHAARGLTGWLAGWLARIDDEQYRQGVVQDLSCGKNKHTAKKNKGNNRKKGAVRIPVFVGHLLGGA